MAVIDDPQRLAALRASGLVDSPAEEGFDRITRLVRSMLGTPTALISLVDRERQFFKSASGLGEPWASRRGTPLAMSLCRTVVTSERPFIVDDAARDPRTANHPAVTELGVAAYAGVPLVTPDGEHLGALCTIDSTPRHWSERDCTILADLAEIVMDQARLLQLARDHHSAHRLMTTVLESMDEALVVADTSSRLVLQNDAARALLGDMVPGALLPGAYDAQIFLPDGVTPCPPMQLPLQRAMCGESVRQVELVVRNPDTGSERWQNVNASPLLDDSGSIVGAVEIGRDVTDARELAQAMASEQMAVELLLGVARDVGRVESAHEAFRVGIERICRAVGWPIGHVYVPDGDGLVSSGVWYIDGGSVHDSFRAATEALRFSRGDGLVGEVLATGRPGGRLDLAADPGFVRTESAQRSGLATGFAAPVRIGDEVAAVFELFTTERRRDVADLPRAVPEAASMVGRVIERERAASAREQHLADAEQRSLRDDLTGLLNRRGLMQMVGPQRALLRRKRRTGLLFYFDLDGLKTANDHLGHAAGDVLLRDAADALRAVFREVDAVARIGGDELVVFAPEATAAARAGILARLDRELGDRNRGRPGPALAWSVGVIEVRPDDAASLDDLLTRADAAMYEVKRNRRTAR
jgi:diguanylate cyclase (GGDEF)-like protein